MAAATQQAPPEEDKELRGNIRGLLSKARSDKHNLVSVENNRIVEIVQQSNQLVEKVTRPRDQAIDAELFSYVTEQGLDWIEGLKQGGRIFTAGDLIRRLKVQHMTDDDAQLEGAVDPEAFDWAALGALQSVAHLFCGCPVVHHMLGPMGSAPRPRRQVQRQARRRAEPVGEAVRPDEVADLQDAEKQETDRNMEEMWGVLQQQGGRVRLLDLVVNHASFAQTVENMFTLSFLVRDNKAELVEDKEEGIQVVRRAAVKADPKDKGPQAERAQFLIPQDIDTWEAWKKVTDSSRPPLMKHRKERRQHHQQQQQQQDANQGGQDDEEPDAEAHGGSDEYSQQSQQQQQATQGRGTLEGQQEQQAANVQRRRQSPRGKQSLQQASVGEQEAEEQEGDGPEKEGTTPRQLRNLQQVKKQRLSGGTQGTSGGRTAKRGRKG